MKQANVSVRMAWISFGGSPCRKISWWQLASRCCWNRALPWHASEFVSFLVWLRTYQHPRYNGVRLNTIQIIAFGAWTFQVTTLGPQAIIARRVTLHITLISIWLQHRTPVTADKAEGVSTIACLVQAPTFFLIMTFKPTWRHKELPS